MMHFKTTLIEEIKTKKQLGQRYRTQSKTIKLLGSAEKTYERLGSTPIYQYSFDGKISIKHEKSNLMRWQ